jgi:hypothetical protein
MFVAFYNQLSVFSLQFKKIDDKIEPETKLLKEILVEDYNEQIEIVDMI